MSTVLPRCYLHLWWYFLSRNIFWQFPMSILICSWLNTSLALRKNSLFWQNNPIPKFQTQPLSVKQTVPRIFKNIMIAEYIISFREETISQNDAIILVLCKHGRLSTISLIKIKLFRCAGSLLCFRKTLFKKNNSERPAEPLPAKKWMT